MGQLKFHWVIRGETERQQMGTLPLDNEEGQRAKTLPLGENQRQKTRYCLQMISELLIPPFSAHVIDGNPAVALDLDSQA